MEAHAETFVDAKLKTLVRHLVTSFPHAAILSRPVEEPYHLFLIVPYSGTPEKAIRIERTLLVERNPSVHDFSCLLDSLNLTTFLEGNDWYELTYARWTHQSSKGARYQSSPPRSAGANLPPRSRKN